jgi:hypothetical protein
MSLFGIKDEDIKYKACATNVFLQKPERINLIEGKYKILVSRAVEEQSFNEINYGINLMANNGWRCHSIFSYDGRLAALMERL